MIARVNGQDVELAEGLNIEAFLLQGKINLSTVVVEHNAKILKPQEWQGVILQPNDILEIISFVCGG
ncbi:MAG: thiamine biosynthesis protein ThiS [Candidatus Omnitrophica bacterium CG1_02_44_16]|nr:MAG: thiamine biosynthesis protein ThiS [Candidatus Omnitrophica bacterium CG1_02_44_16]PIY82024.1 MAG: thiamine biosynthesis protein ThiS [Candidatus Omnitrophica bacterium CG_4_10_14_0_8_um_filter_44_12]PIZ84637.1 MAG: thiamine biosynthesis protein ThiS [Candidatus Omnitrophica bacterium CG_4_10_14_0_2_um_filter_44_9]